MSQILPRTSKRKPPMPVVPKGGCCRWCASPILHPAGHKRAGQPNLRRRWCNEADTSCVRNYLIASQQGKLRSALWRRDRGRCQSCGLRCGREGWDADHRIPLWRAPPHPSLADRAIYWSLDNAQTLCTACHKHKCAQEAAERAALRRLANRSSDAATRRRTVTRGSERAAKP